MIEKLAAIIKNASSLQPNYKQKYEKSKEKNVFKPTDTEQYKAMKENEKASSDVSFMNCLVKTYRRSAFTFALFVIIIRYRFCCKSTAFTYLYCYYKSFYSPSCLGQETAAKRCFGLLVQLPPAHLSTIQGVNFTLSL